MRMRQMLTITIILTAAPRLATAGVNPDHIVIGQSPPDGPQYKLFTADWLEGASGHGPSIPPGAIIPIPRIGLSSAYAQPRFGGYSFSPSGDQNLGLDYAANAGHELFLSYLEDPPANFQVAFKRLSYSRPADFSVYTEFGSPRMVEDNDEYQFGDAFDGGHKHPLFLIRRPGQVLWTMKITSDVWLESDVYQYTWTSVPGRGLLVPLDMGGLFNADVVDSDASDTPTAFDDAGNVWVLDGNYGTDAGLPVDGALAGFQLGGPDGSDLGGSNLNALLDDATHSLADTLDLTRTGQADQYLTVEVLIGGSGSFSTSDIVTMTLGYDDGTTKAVQIRKGTSTYLPYRPIEDWEQASTPRPWTAIGVSGDREAGFARSTGSGIDDEGGEDFFLFRAGTPADSGKTLETITFADYPGDDRVAIFAILAIKKGPLVITTDSLLAAQEGIAYSVLVTAAGTPPFKNWTAEGLPAGLTMEADTSEIAGTPGPGTADGSPYTVTISVEDSINDYDPAYPVETATVMLDLIVGAGGGLPGDINDDGMVDEADLALFVAVLLGQETDPDVVTRSDMNGDGLADGADAQLFVAAIIGG